MPKLISLGTAPAEVLRNHRTVLRHSYLLFGDGDLDFERLFKNKQTNRQTNQCGWYTGVLSVTTSDHLKPENFDDVKCIDTAGSKCTQLL